MNTAFQPGRWRLAIKETLCDHGWERLYSIDRRCHRGTAADGRELCLLLKSRRANEIVFDADVYKLLRKYLSRPDMAQMKIFLPPQTGVCA